jgi:hypothetical protein
MKNLAACAALALLFVSNQAIALDLSGVPESHCFIDKTGSYWNYLMTAAEAWWYC